MPAKNIIKTYISGGIYHIYNRGVDGRTIFLDTQDYHVFLSHLKEALSDPVDLNCIAKSIPVQGYTLTRHQKPKNFIGKIELLAYALMPNHFHFLIKQITDRDMHPFMQSVTARYSMYLNKKHHRIGSLFQSTYKASRILDEPYLLHVSRYIHKNPTDYFEKLEDAYSSYGEYLGLRRTPWIKTDLILSFFTHQSSKTLCPFLKHTNSYKEFVEYEKDIDPQYYDESITLET